MSFDNTKTDIAGSDLGKALSISANTKWNDIVNKIKSIVNRGGINTSLNCGGSYTLSSGYYTGGKITANSLSSQTSANATASQILSGKTAWVNGNKITGTLSVQSAISFHGKIQQKDLGKVYLFKCQRLEILELAAEQENIQVKEIMQQLMVIIM